MQEHKSNESSNKTAFLLITIAIAYLMLGSIPVFAQAVVSITPESSTMETNENFSVFVNIEPETPFVGVQLNIDFNGSLITANRIVEGGLFEDEESLHIFNEGTINNQDGTVSGVYAALLGGEQIDESGLFVEVEFSSGDQEGYSDLGLSNLILSDSEGHAIPFSIENEGITITAPTEEEETEEAVSGSGGGGGSLGGDAGSTEDVENIDLKEAKSAYVSSNKDIAYQFSEQSNPLTSISYHSLKNSGQISCTIEVLKDTSSAVTDNPPGKVYRHINIWVGKTGYANEENIENAVIGFSVPREWLSSNGFDAGSIRLNRFSDGKWNELETTIAEENDDMIFFEAKTPGFSPFAITASEASETVTKEKETVLLEEETNTDDSQKEVVDNGESTETTRGLGQNSAFLLIVSLFAVAILRKK